MSLVVGAYRLEPPFHESSTSSVSRGRTPDGRPVVAKLVRGAALSFSSIASLRHEHRMMSTVRSPYVPSVLDFVYEPGQHAALLMEDIGARGSLEDLLDAPLDIEVALRIAIGGAAALDAVHRHGITHYDVKPRNLIWVPDSQRVQLIDFGLAMQLETNDPELSGHEDLVGTLPYLSPEQTGRMNCGVDHRSDLYSFGVVLYRLLSGALPFEADDPLGWVHAHLAARPVPLAERAPRVPAPLSEIVGRLLEKDRERRYRSAAGLGVDLRECARQLAEQPTIRAFELGREDVLDRFRIPDRLYGRESDVAAMHEAFERVDGATRAELILVRGGPGVGKSSLVRELVRPLTLRRGLLIEGKYDALHRATPFTGLIAAFEDAAGQLLRLPEDELERWRSAILAEVGRNAGVLTDLAPTLGHVLGPQPAAPALGDIERLNRLELVVERFIHALARPDHPLVIFLDDLQWIDGASLTLFQHLLTSPDAKSMVVIAAYRDSEVDAGHPLSETLTSLQQAGVVSQHLVLGPLEPRDVARLLADALHRPAEEVAPLAALVHERTRGNPFFVRQFLSALHDEGAIRFDHERRVWTWDLERGAELASTDNVSSLLVARFDALGARTRRLLQLAACLGHRFDLRTLATAADLSLGETLATLWPALEGGLVLVQGNLSLRDPQALDHGAAPEEATSTALRLAHDRIQQAALSSLGDDARRHRAHLEVGRRLLADLDAPARAPDARLFQVADQLNAGRGAIEEEAERLRVAQLDLECGRRASSSAAYSAAVAYLEVAAELVDAAAAPRRAWFEVHLELSRAYSLAGDFASAAAEHPKLFARAEGLEQQLAVQGLVTDLAVLTSAFDDALAGSLAALDLLDEAPPRDPAALAASIGGGMAEIERLLAERDLDEIRDGPPLEAPAHARLLEELDRLSTVAYLANDWLLYPWAVVQMTRLSLLHGITALSGLAFATFGALLTIQGQYARAPLFGDLGVALAERCGRPGSRGRAAVARFVLAGLFELPLRELPAHVYRAHPSCLEAGDLTYAGYLLLFGDHLELASGAPLGEIEQEVRRHLPFLARSTPITLGLFYVPYVVFLLCALRGQSTTAMGFELDSDRFLASVAEVGIAKGWHCSALLEVAVSTCAPVDVETLEAYVASVQEGVRGQLLPFAASFCGALLALEQIRAGAPGAARAHELVQQWHEHLTAAAEAYPPNFAAMARIVDAERARTRGDHDAAIAGYERAIELSREHELLHQLALALRLYADYWVERGAPATGRAHAEASIERYREWGADGVVATLEARFDVSPRAAHGASSTRTKSSTRSLRQLDLETITRAARALSSETHIAALLERLAQILRDNMGASRCLVLRREGLTWAVAATSPSDEPAAFSEAVANYVGRSGEFLLQDEPARGSRWSNDPHISERRPRSLLCAPIRLEDRTLALVYAENDLTAHAFGADHLTLLHTVLAQTAVSLENARLFDALEQEQALWHSLVDNAADLIVVVDRDHRVTFVNRSSEGFVLTPRLGVPVEVGFEAEDRERVRAAIDHTFEHGTQSTLEAQVQVDGEVQHLGVRVGAIHARGSERVSLIVADVSAQRRLAEQLRQSQKMEAVGTLAGGVAHDFNNLLTVIQGSCELLLLNPPADPEDRTCLEEIAQAGARASDLTRKLLAFSRKQVLQPRTFEADGLVDDVTRLLGRMLGEDIQLSVALGAPGALVTADRSGLEQVVLNLAVNARDAMPRGGRLTIATALAQADGRPCWSVRVDDEGVGMDAATQRRIFDPFFTTKQPGRGTGLGLAMVHAIVERTGGTIQVDSAPGEGACFTILVPAVEDEPATVESVETVDLPTGTEIVALVEDDDLLRRLAERMLRKLGYEVKAFASAAAAIEGLGDGPVDLLLTDVVMPEISGPELATHLLRRRADLRVLFTSGYTDDAMVRHGVAEGKVALLPKPFSLSTLATKVREVLERG